jgi:tetratricopeptide (TPR) repeat protein
MLDPIQAFNQASAFIKSEAFESADQTLLTALALYPNDPNLLRMQGISFARQYRFEDAKAKLVHSLRIIPDNLGALEDLADVHLSLRELDPALTLLQRAIKHSPDAERIRQRIVQLLTMAGRHTEAESALADSLEANPRRKRLSDALRLANENNFVGAEAIYQEVLRQQPDDVDALRLLGVLRVRLGQYDEGAACFRRAVDLQPDFWKAWVNLGAALSEQQDFDAAEAAYARALELQPQSPHILERMGVNALKASELEKCIDCLERSLAIAPNYFPSLLCMGHALKTVGRQDEAIDAYRSCAALKEDFGEAYWSLANLKTFRFDDDEVAKMESALETLTDAKVEEEAESEIAFAFTLGKAYEDRKDYSKAFDYYYLGNSKKRSRVQYDPIEFQDSNDRIIDVFNKEFFAERKDWGFQDDSPILIVGLPRSGSTLLEQILASHSRVEGTAELHYLLRAASQSGLNRSDGIKYPQVMHELLPHQVRGIGEEYIEHSLKHRTGSPFFTDKMPNNFTAIGFLHAILPNAKVIDARRHPLDSCLGAFKQLFASGQVFSYDLYDLAHYYSQYMRMMSHWDDVLPGKVLTCHYEHTVADLEAQANQIASHCGLEMEASMLNFHSNKRAVRTASSEQVRQPIYSSSVALWRRYESELEELIDYLEPVLRDLPASQRPAHLQLD